MTPREWGRNLAIGALVLWLTGCASHERDMAVYDLWAKRGQVLGDLAHLYCEQGARRERDMMEWAINRSSYPARVTIECDEPARPEPR
jgi:hypothetical protein